MKYKNFIIQKFIGLSFKKGKQFKGINLLLHSLSFLKKNQNKKPIESLIKSLDIVKPLVSYIRLRRGSKVFYLPKLLSIENQYKQGIGWILRFSKSDKKRNIKDAIEIELALIFKNQGKSITEKNKIYSLLLDSRPYLYLLKWT